MDTQIGDWVLFVNGHSNAPKACLSLAIVIAIGTDEVCGTLGGEDGPTCRIPIGAIRDTRPPAPQTKKKREAKP